MDPLEATIKLILEGKEPVKKAGLLQSGKVATAQDRFNKLQLDFMSTSPLTRLVVSELGPDARDEMMKIQGLLDKAEAIWHALLINSTKK